MNDFTMVEASLGHLELLSLIHTEAFASVGERGWSEEEFASTLSIPGTAIRIARSGEEPVGLVVLRQIVDEAEILTICSLPEWRGKGAGRALLQSAISLTRSNACVNLFLDVRGDNEAAIGLYRTFGFKNIDERKGYFRLLDGSRRDALVMKLTTAATP